MCQFWCPLRLNVIQYLIWKVSIVVWNPKLGLNVAALLHCITPLWKVPISLHKQATQRFHMNIAVCDSTTIIKLVYITHHTFLELCLYLAAKNSTSGLAIMLIAARSQSGYTLVDGRYNEMPFICVSKVLAENVWRIWNDSNPFRPSHLKRGLSVCLVKIV